MGAIILTILITGIVWRQMACEEVWYCTVLLLICRNAVLLVLKIKSMKKRNDDDDVVTGLIFGIEVKRLVLIFTSSPVSAENENSVKHLNPSSKNLSVTVMASR